MRGSGVAGGLESLLLAIPVYSPISVINLIDIKSKGTVEGITALRNI